MRRKEALFRLGWVGLGVSPPAVFWFVTSYWDFGGLSNTLEGAVFPLVSALGVVLQGLWARKWSLQLNVRDFAVLWLIGCFAQSGLAYFGEEHLRSEDAINALYILGMILVVAAPSQPLRWAGVRIWEWWLWNIIGIALFCLVMDYAVAEYVANQDTLSLPIWAIDFLSVSVGDALLVWLASKAVWRAVQRTEEKAQRELDDRLSWE